MIKAIIITYNFKPQNITSVQRPYAWAKYFKKSGIYPIIITKNWNSHITDKVEIDENDDYKLYKVKTNLILKEEFAEIKGIKGKVLRSIFRLLHLFFYDSFKFGPNRDFYNVAKNIISQMDNPKVLIVTTMPYGLFRVAYKLHNDTGIKWIADYRDDWTTSEIPEKNILKRVLLKTIYRNQEIKWVSTASRIVSVSTNYVDKILKLLDFEEDKGFAVENGYFEEDHPLSHKNWEKENSITFTYVGSLYDSQDLLPLITALNRAVIELELKGSVKFVFLGTALNSKIKRRIIKTGTHLEFVFHKRMSKQEALLVQNRSHYAVMCPHKGLKGIPSSKLYEFVGARMPVIYYPNDNDIINETLKYCGLGFTAEDEKSLVDVFKKALELKLTIKEKNCLKYSRFHSTQKMALEIKELLK